MSLTLTDTPIRTVNGILSNVVAIKSQIPFEFLRVDAVSNIVDSPDFPGTHIAIQSFINPELSETEIGDLFYFDFGGVYPSGVYAATDITVGSPFFISFEIPYTADVSANTNYLTLRKNYSVAVNLILTATGTDVLPNAIRFKPKQDGTLFMDLHGLFFGFELINDFAIVRLVWAENYNDTFHDQGTSDEIIGIPGYKQIGEDGGSTIWKRILTVQSNIRVTRVNLAGDSTEEPIFLFDPGIPANPFITNDFVTVDVPTYSFTEQVTAFANTAPEKWIKMDTQFLGPIVGGGGNAGNIGTARTPGGLFLTDFDNPLCWLYFRRTISFVIDSDLSTRLGSATIRLNVVGKDSIGVVIDTIDTDYNTVGIHSFMLPLNTVVATWEVKVLGGVGFSDQVSEIKIFKQLKSCRNPVMLEWDNRAGDLEQHLFQINQLIEDTVDAGLTYAPPIVETLDEVDIGVGRLPLDSQQFITLTAEKVSRNFVDQLHFIKRSEIVNLYLNSDGSKKTRVAVVSSFTNAYETDKQLFDFTIKIQLPQNFSLSYA